MNKQIKQYDSRNVVHKAALLHAVGQLLTINPDGISISDIASFMNRSKPMAQRVLDQLVKQKKLIKIKVNETAKGKIYYGMTDDMLDMFEANAFRLEYEIYVQRVLGVILQ